MFPVANKLKIQALLVEIQPKTCEVIKSTGRIIVVNGSP